MSQTSGNAHSVIGQSIDITQLNFSHLNLPITDVNLCAYLRNQWDCDECYSHAPRKEKFDLKKDQPPANHYALWFGFGAENRVHVGIDVVPEQKPYEGDERNKQYRDARAFVRVASKKVPTHEDIGCVMREFNVKPGTTIATILLLIISKNLHDYRFTLKENKRKRVKQQAGCRFWIYQISKELEEAEIVGRGFRADVWEFLHVYFFRRRKSTVSETAEFIPENSWAPHSQNFCAPVERGTFVDRGAEQE